MTTSISLYFIVSGLTANLLPEFYADLEVSIAGTVKPREVPVKEEGLFYRRFYVKPISTSYLTHCWRNPHSTPLSCAM